MRTLRCSNGIRMKCAAFNCIKSQAITTWFVSSRTLILIMLPSPKQSEGHHAPDILRFMTTDRILAAIDDEIARLKKVRALLSTSASTKGGVTAPARKRRSSVQLPGRKSQRRSGSGGPNRREAPPGSESGSSSADLSWALAWNVFTPRCADPASANPGHSIANVAMSRADRCAGSVRGIHPKNGRESRRTRLAIADGTINESSKEPHIWHTKRWGKRICAVFWSRRH